MASFQETAVEFTPSGQLRVKYTYMHGEVSLGGDLFLEKTSAAWFCDRLRQVADEVIDEDELHAPPDHLKVYTGGGQRYEDINISVLNHRDEGTVLSGLFAMTKDTARGLAKQIEGLLKASV